MLTDTWITVAWMCQPLHPTTKTNNDNDTDTGSGGGSGSGSSNDDIGARTRTRARSRTRSTTSGPKRPYRVATRASNRPYRMVIYERNNDRHIQDLDQVVALLTAGTTRTRAGARAGAGVDQGTRARAGTGARTGAGVDQGTRARAGASFRSVREGRPANASGAAVVNANANTSTSATATSTGNDGDGNGNWDIEVRKPSHTPYTPLYSLSHPPTDPLTHLLTLLTYNMIHPLPQVVRHSDDIDPCALH